MSLSASLDALTPEARANIGWRIEALLQEQRDIDEWRAVLATGDRRAIISKGEKWSGLPSVGLSSDYPGDFGHNISRLRCCPVQLSCEPITPVAMRGSIYAMRWRHGRGFGDSANGLAEDIFRRAVRFYKLTMIREGDHAETLNRWKRKLADRFYLTYHFRRSVGGICAPHDGPFRRGATIWINGQVYYLDDTQYNMILRISRTEQKLAKLEKRMART